MLDLSTNGHSSANGHFETRVLVQHLCSTKVARFVVLLQLSGLQSVSYYNQMSAFLAAIYRSSMPFMDDT